MLTLLADQPECLWDDALPVESGNCPRIWRRWMCCFRSRVAVADRGALAPGVRGDRSVGVDRGAADDRDGDVRPVDGAQATVSVGVRTLVAEVSDSIHLRRFCRISLSDRVPDESTVRKLTRRIGSETVSELTRALIVKATREKRFRPRAVRIDSTVIEAGVRYPTDSGLASGGVRTLARERRKLARLVGERMRRVRDRSRSMGRKLRAISRTIRRRSGGGQGGGAEADRADWRVVGALDRRGAQARQDRARARREVEAEGGRRTG
jgi:IS5 family transposase